ncbi:ferric reductase-like transmembrane domain-containing protein [Streptosporangium sp. NPDC000396]|uniref:ferredoxin reductase family protein n=1 Tax=Streptosporangium sp. NPDC000396 TaxID=3366185 RepID=UPI0036B5F1C3
MLIVTKPPAKHGPPVSHRSRRSRWHTTTPPKVSPRVFLRSVIAGGGLVIGLWAVQVVPSLRASALLATGAHLTGLLAGYGIWVALLLMARIPAVELGVGADRLARWHAFGGRWVLGLSVAHTLLALWGFAAHTGTGAAGAVRGLVGYPALAAATVGILILAAVGVISARAVRRMVTYEAWRSVHLLAYLGAALAFAHQPAGPDLAGIPVLAWIWSIMHAQVAVLLVWYRLIVPVRQALRHSLRVAGVFAEGPGVVSVYMVGKDLNALQVEPGQFFRWRFMTRRLWRTALPFSLSAPIWEDTLRITVQVVGGHTRRIRRLRPGTRVLATGPFGAMTGRSRTRRKVLLLAGGVGITPMRALFETLPGGPGDITLLYRASSADRLVFTAELEAIARRRHRRLHYLLGSSRGIGNPLTPAKLREVVPDIAEHDAYVCGPPQMTAASIGVLRRAGIPRRRIHFELFEF